MSGVDLSTATYTTLAGDSITSLTGPNSANKALDDIKLAINQLAADRASLGAHIEVLTMYSDQLGTLKNNLSSANSRITDVDVAQESTRYAKYNILVQSGTAMLAQANALPQSVLKLLQ
jgi:flagellin